MKVSIAMITYNHENFIAQAIESMLMQEVSFDYEIVIGEDCSTDGTRDIVLAFQERYPDRIRLLLQENNLGMMRNYAQTLQACRGEYTAFLEGDDYWTCSQKLQRQAEFLDGHPEYTACFHNVMMVHEDDGRAPQAYCPEGQKTVWTLEDLLLHNPIPHCSVMFRRGLFGQFPDWFYSMGMGDRPLYILNAQHGDIGYIDEVMGVYRIHPGGVYSGRSHDVRLRETLRMYDVINAHLGFKYERTITRAKAEHVALALAEKAKTTGSFEEGTALAIRAFERWRSDLAVPASWRAKALGQVYAHYFFSSYADRDFPTVRRSFLQLLRYAPSWLRNRGVWSILVEVFLGSRVAGLLRRSAARI